MKLKSKFIIEFSIEIAEGYSIPYSVLYEFFGRNELSEIVSNGGYGVFIYHMACSTCDEVLLKYFLDNNMIEIESLSNMKPYYNILSEDFLPILTDIQELFIDVLNNYTNYEREHTINNILD